MGPGEAVQAPGAPAEESGGKSECSLLLFLATPAEEDGLGEAAEELGIPFERIGKNASPFGEEYRWLGRVGDETLIAVSPARHHGHVVMGSIGFLGTAARAMRVRTATGAQGIVQLGMGFGVDPRRQKAGDVLVSTSIVPYDNRKSVV
jgi:nucleoside phosphorylase